MGQAVLALASLGERAMRIAALRDVSVTHGRCALAPPVPISRGLPP